MIYEIYIKIRNIEGDYYIQFIFSLFRTVLHKRFIVKLISIRLMYSTIENLYDFTYFNLRLTDHVVLGRNMSYKDKNPERIIIYVIDFPPICFLPDFRCSRK